MGTENMTSDKGSGKVSARDVRGSSPERPKTADSVTITPWGAVSADWLSGYRQCRTRMRHRLERQLIQVALQNSATARDTCHIVL